MNINPGFCLQKIREITVCADMGITADTASVSENEREHVCVCVCVCVCVRVYVVYEDTNLYNNMGMTEVLQFEGVL